MIIVNLINRYLVLFLLNIFYFSISLWAVDANPEDESPLSKTCKEFLELKSKCEDPMHHIIGEEFFYHDLPFIGNNMDTVKEVKPDRTLLPIADLVNVSAEELPHSDSFKKASDIINKGIKSDEGMEFNFTACKWSDCDSCRSGYSLNWRIIFNAELGCYAQIYTDFKTRFRITPPFRAIKPEDIITEMITKDKWKLKNYSLPFASKHTQVYEFHLKEPDEKPYVGHMILLKSFLENKLL